MVKKKKTIQEQISQTQPATLTSNKENPLIMKPEPKIEEQPKEATPSGNWEVGEYKDFTTIVTPEGKQLIFKDKDEAKEYFERQRGKEIIPKEVVSEKEVNLQGTIEREKKKLMAGLEFEQQKQQIKQEQEQQKAPPLSTLSGITNVLEGKPVKVGGKEIKTGLGGREDIVAGIAPIGIPSVIGFGGSAAGTTTAGKILSFKNVATLFGLGTLITRQSNSATNILTQSLSASEDLIKQLDDNLITPARAEELFQEYSGYISEAERGVNISSKLNVFNFLGLKDNLAKFEIANSQIIPALRQRLNEAQANAILRQRGLI